MYGYLTHHGIKGQKWGIRRYQNPDGSLTSQGKSRYGKAKTYRDLRKVSKNIFKESLTEYKDKNPNVDKTKLKLYKQKLSKNVKELEGRYIAKNYKKFYSSNDNVENSVLDIVSIIGGLTTDLGGLFIATPVGVGAVAAGLTATSLSLGAKLADSTIDKIRNKSIDEALSLYGNNKKEKRNA